VNKRRRAAAAIAAAALLIATGVAFAQEDSAGHIDPADPPDVPGQCFAKVLVPATYRTTSEDFILRAPAQRIETTPPRFEWVEESIVARQASEKLIPVRAVFKKVREEVVVQDPQLVWRTSKQRRGEVADDLTVARAVASGLPANAESGTCFAEYFNPAEYEKVDLKVIKKEAAKRFEVTQAVYETIEEEVVLQEASEEFVEVPAGFETVTEEVMTRPAYAILRDERAAARTVGDYSAASMRRIETPAEHESLQRHAIVEPARTKKIPIEAKTKTIQVRRLASGPTQTSVEIEAEYQTYEKTVLKSAASISWRLEDMPGSGKATGRLLCRSELPAKTAKIDKWIVEKPATVQSREIPQESLPVRRRKLVAAATERRIELEAEKRNITRFAKTSDERLEWQRALCRDDATLDLVRALQQALSDKGFPPGPIDGAIGRATLTAVERFQVAEGLATGAITVQTIEALGLTIP
jgi:hypothetical protein